MIQINDPADERVADFRDLTHADRRPDRPGGRGLVIAEGVVVVRRLLDSPYPVRALLGVARRFDELADDIAEVDVPAYVASAEVMAEIVGFHLNRGVLAVADRAEQPPAEQLVATSRRLAVLEGVGDHENLGALFRNAAALGIDGVLLGAGCSDPLYRRSVRVSMGHVLRVPFTTLTPWPDGLNLLRDNGFRVAALTPRPGSVALPAARLDQGRVAVLLGAEGPGLTEAAISAADLAVRIPMTSGVDSLNVATAAAIAFYATAAHTTAGPTVAGPTTARATPAGQAPAGPTRADPPAGG
ncbi:tRNA G18 (ribose-2'-O)-methylase SpoU [Goodfellowiella coeruleoviolacea]|uniref:tRNA G18 (Ribose-2'-O)-methylase SpoU n=1 Tax=Goodfellowiella coeruleoviolacea TaxID=334858 RepID=A0AAE3GJ99_9PSEU|nr:tRNA G18 (ribose-2'-O)-methylase SpoU [Goodfellowiella coeruleoviolacea]